jgi:hypothetical protein
MSSVFVIDVKSIGGDCGAGSDMIACFSTKRAAKSYLVSKCIKLIHLDEEYTTFLCDDCAQMISNYICCDKKTCMEYGETNRDKTCLDCKLIRDTVCQYCGPHYIYDDMEMVDICDKIDSNEFNFIEFGDNVYDDTHNEDDFEWNGSRYRIIEIGVRD